MLKVTVFTKKPPPFLVTRPPVYEVYNRHHCPIQVTGITQRPSPLITSKVMDFTGEPSPYLVTRLLV